MGCGPPAWPALGQFAPAGTAGWRLSHSQFAAFILLEDKEDGAMGHFHYSKGFGVPLAAALGLMLARRALAQSAAPKLWLASYKLALAPSASSIGRASGTARRGEVRD